jgi:hypothetical protein
MIVGVSTAATIQKKPSWQIWIPNLFRTNSDFGNAFWRAACYFIDPGPVTTNGKRFDDNVIYEEN